MLVSKNTAVARDVERAISALEDEITPIISYAVERVAAALRIASGR